VVVIGLVSEVFISFCWVSKDNQEIKFGQDSLCELMLIPKEFHPEPVAEKCPISGNDGQTLLLIMVNHSNHIIN